MKRSLWLALIVVLVAGNLFIAPTGPDPVGAADAASATGDAALLQIPGLKAVLIVGPIDGGSGAWTQQEMANMELAASFLEAQGVTVHRFYAPQDDWQAIVAAARDAQFLLYRGHGAAWNSLPDVGGFKLTSGMVAPDQIVRDLALAPDAIVMMYACYSAGSSGAETADIGLAEARRRVGQYSAPFLDLGIAGYYANWHGDAFEQFLRLLFTGQSLGDAYKSYFDFNPETAQPFTHPDEPNVTGWLDKNNWRGYWQYSNTFVGASDATLLDLFGTAELGGMPERLRFVYSTSEGRYLTDTYTVVPRNVASSLSIAWSLDVAADWISVTRTSGTTSDHTFTVTPNLTSPSRTRTYAGTLTVSSATTGESQQIALELSVTDGAFARTYLPLTTALRDR